MASVSPSARMLNAGQHRKTRMKRAGMMKVRRAIPVGLVRFRLRDFDTSILRDFICTRSVHLKRLTTFKIFLKTRNLEVSKWKADRSYRNSSTCPQSHFQTQSKMACAGNLSHTRQLSSGRLIICLSFAATTQWASHIGQSIFVVPHSGLRRSVN